MGCVASRLEEEEEVVSICRERKRQLKLAVERRYALADAHFRYCKSLYGVSAAIHLFVARHSSPLSPFLITFPPPSPPPSPPEQNVISNPLFLQQTPSEPTKEAIPNCDISTSSESSVDEVEKEQGPKEEVCGYFYMDLPQTIASPHRDNGWDFFNPFTGVTRTDVFNAYNRISEEDLRVVREQEGIPELEDEAGEKVVEEKRAFLTKKRKDEEECVTVQAVNVPDSSPPPHPKGLTVIDTPVRGRELLEALKDIEDHFIKCYHSGTTLSRMLECNKIHLQSNLDEIKENSTKLIQAIPWRSASSRLSSCKSLVASNSKNWTEFRNDLFDDFGGMDAGSHSLTLGKLYAWEKKLYKEVKDGDSIRRLYERKCHQLRSEDVQRDETEKTRAAVKDLYSRILVAIRSAETVSKTIEKLRDEELEPQIRELLQGFMRAWKMMLESHNIQNKIIFEVKTFTCPSYGKFCNESHRLATLQLETELVNWRECFTKYIAAQKGYVDAIYRWLSKFIAPEIELYSRGRSCVRSNGLPLLVVCGDWLEAMEKLPDKAVSLAIKSCSKDVRALWFQQGEEQQQKRKVDSLSKELDKKMSGAENGSWVADKYASEEGESWTDSSNDALRRRVEVEKEKHLKCMQETESITLDGFQTGFCRVFEALREFSAAALKMYNQLSDIENDEQTYS